MQPRKIKLPLFTMTILKRGIAQLNPFADNSIEAWVNLIGEASKKAAKAFDGFTGAVKRVEQATQIPAKDWHKYNS